jgi:hypothetical protein
MYATIVFDQSLLCVVDVEEIRVQNSLDETCDNRNGLKVALGDPTVDPVGNIQGSISTQSEEVVGGNGLCLACSL